VSTFDVFHHVTRCRRHMASMVCIRLCTVGLVVESSLEMLMRAVALYGPSFNRVARLRSNLR
jgi:hypothetical protein